MRSCTYLTVGIRRVGLRVHPVRSSLDRQDQLSRQRAPSPAKWPCVLTVSFFVLFFYLNFRCPLCLGLPTLNLSRNPCQTFPNTSRLAHLSSLFACCFATTCAVRCELSEEISADQRSYHPNPNFFPHFGFAQGGPLPWARSVARYRGPAPWF